MDDAMPDNLLSRLDHYGKIFPDRMACVFLKKGVEQETISYQQLVSEANYFADILIKSDLAGSQIALLLETGIDFVVAFLGCLKASAIAVPVNLTHNEHQLKRTLTILAGSEIAGIVAEPAVGERIQKNNLIGDTSQKFRWLNSFREEYLPGLHCDYTFLPIAADQVAFLQYTSGSTSKPKGIEITHGNLDANLNMIASVFQLQEGFISGGWLPQFHDMGLIGQLLTPLYMGGTSIFMSPMEFIQRPFLWLQMISDYKIMATASPNFGYDYAVKRIKHESMKGLDLSCLKVALCGSEPVHYNTLTQFANSFAEYGLDERALSPCYGLAEATLLVSGLELESSPKYLSLDKARLEEGIIEKSCKDSMSFTVVSCGKIAPGLDVRIVDPDTGIELNQAADILRLGEIWIAGPSIAKGVFNQPDNDTFNQTLYGSSKAYMRTGDLGFIHDDQLYINGRIKEMLILQGKNIFPYDIENSINQFEYAAGHNGALIYEDEKHGQACISVFVELKRKYFYPDSFREIEMMLRTHLHYEIGISLNKINFCLPGTIPRTTSGKVCRFAFKALLEKIKQNESVC